jgi:hypothetical protein
MKEIDKKVKSALWPLLYYIIMEHCKRNILLVSVRRLFEEPIKINDLVNTIM